MIRGKFASPRRTMIRKTSLLHKIDPTALRSSFADVLHRWREYPRTTFAGDNTRSHEMHGDSAPLHGHTKAARGARIDLLFTMSDITRAQPKAMAREFVFSRTKTKAKHQVAAPSGGARRDRTDDLLLAKQALSQLSYGPSPVEYWCQDCWLAEPQLAAASIARLR